MHSEHSHLNDITLEVGHVLPYDLVFIEKYLMEEYIYNLPSLLLFSLISITFILISFGAIMLVDKRLPVSFRYDQNPAIVSVSAIIGIIYAILIGFTVLYELDNYNKADNAEKDEAKTMFSIFRMARSLPEPASTAIREQISKYAYNVINNEWPAMAQGKRVDDTGITIITTIAHQMHSIKNSPNAPASSMDALNTIAIDINALFDDHQERVTKSHKAISANLWFVLLLGSLLTIAINFLLGIEFRLHLICTVAICLMVSAVLYLIITLDRPYRGDFSIQPDTFQSSYDYIQLHRDIKNDILK